MKGKIDVRHSWFTLEDSDIANCELRMLPTGTFILDINNQRIFMKGKNMNEQLTDACINLSKTVINEINKRLKNFFIYVGFARKMFDSYYIYLKVSLKSDDINRPEIATITKKLDLAALEFIDNEISKCPLIKDVLLMSSYKKCEEIFRDIDFAKRFIRKVYNRGVKKYIGYLGKLKTRDRSPRVIRVKYSNVGVSIVFNKSYNWFRDYEYIFISYLGKMEISTAFLDYPKYKLMAIKTIYNSLIFHTDPNFQSFVLKFFLENKHEGK